MDYMVLFNVILAGLGVYLLFAASKMQRTGEISSIIVAAEEIMMCKDKKGFIAAIYKPTQIFGIVSVICGVFNTINDLWKVFGKIPGVIGVIIFVLTWFWFLMTVNKARSKFFY